MLFPDAPLIKLLDTTMRTTSLFCSMLAFIMILSLGTASTAHAQYNCAAQSEVAVKDCEALIALYIATTVNEGWSHGTGFAQAVDTDPNNDLPISQWSTQKPVEIENNRVVYVDLSGNNLNGTLPDAICDLEAFRELDLSLNKLTGTIPTCIGNMAALEKLVVKQFDFNLTGPLPESIGDLINLKRLDLAGNELTGPIPTSLGNLLNLEYLILGGNLGLAGNQLSGPIPASLGQLIHLVSLILPNNKLSGTIPASLGDLANLTILDVGSNDLSGSIPASLANLTNLERLVLIGNELTDFEPGAYDTWTSLNYLSLSSNQLTELPALSGLSSLEYLLLANNQLTSLPDLSGLNANTYIDVRWNRLTFGALASLVGFVGQAGFQYVPQYSIPLRQTIENGNIVLHHDAGGGETTTYIWRRRDLGGNGVYMIIEGETGPSYVVTESGQYVANARNSAFPDLTVSGAADVEIDGCPVGKAAAGCGFVVNLPDDTGFPPDDAGNPELPDDGLCDLDPNTEGDQCSLRAALQLARAGFGQSDQEPVVIDFNIPGDAPIRLAEALPEIIKPVLIDGTTQAAGFVHIDGEEVAGIGAGLLVRKGGNGSIITGLLITGLENGRGIVLDRSSDNTIADNFLVGNKGGISLNGGIEDSNEECSRNTIRGNVMGSNSDTGVTLSGFAHENLVEDNFIGTERDGVTPLGNTFGIAMIKSPRNTIRNNVISGNQIHGLLLLSASENIIDGNKIGTNQAGSERLANKEYGIVLDETSYGNFIQHNVISGNELSGVLIKTVKPSEEDKRFNEFTGNFIGTDANGVKSLGNDEFGVEIANTADRVTIRDNVISANLRDGLFVQTGGFAIIEKNKIGTDAHGLEPLGNGGHGIYANGASIWLQENLISANHRSGLYLTGRPLYSILVVANSIGTDTNGADVLGVMGNRDHGIVLDRTGVITIGFNNLIANNHGAGVRAVGVTGFKMEKNKIRQNLVGVEILGGSGQRITSNVIERNVERGINAEEGVRDLIIRNNVVSQNGGVATGIHLTNSHAIIEGNTITDDAGDAITLEDGSTATITNNNIFGNAGMGLNNLTPSVMVTADDNWWGDASGPGGEGPGSGDAVSAGVDVSGWRDAMVAVVVSAEDDEIVLPLGEADTVSVFVQNWQVRDDALDLTISDTGGWLQSPSALTVTLADSTGAEARLAVAVPAGTPNGAASTVEVTAVSQADADHTVTTTFTLRVESAALAQVLVFPGTVNVTPGDTVAFDALGLDQFSRTVAVTPTWTATGGVIDADGVYIAGATAGAFVVTATDPATGLAGTAQVGNGVSVAVGAVGEVPDAFHLAPNYPNPFNPETTIAFTLPQQARVRLAVYDVLGREVSVLVDDALPAGAHRARFDAGRLASGIYVYRLTADRFSQTRTMVLLR